MSDRSLKDIPDPFDDARYMIAPPPPRLSAAPTRRSVRMRAWVALFACVLLDGALIARLGVREIGLSLAVLGIALPLAFGAWAFWMATSSEKRALRAAIIPIGAAFIGLVATSNAGDPSFARALTCAGFTSLFAAAPAAFGLWWTRRAFASSASERALVFAVAVALTGFLAIRLHCSNDSLSHLVQGHFLPMLIVVLAVFAIGRRTSRA